MITNITEMPSECVPKAKANFKLSVYGDLRSPGIGYGFPEITVAHSVLCRSWGYCAQRLHGPQRLMCLGICHESLEVTGGCS